jgi:type II secretory pathway component PulF
MPRYHYTAISTNGKKAKGTVTAESPFEARKQLRIRGIHPTSLDQLKTKQGGRSIFKVLSGKKKKEELLDFTKQMATLLNSGIKLTESLSVLTMQVGDPAFKNALSDIRERVVTGESVSDAMEDYHDYFDIIYVSMVRVGEVTGSLGESFTTIANFMEKRQRVESKVMTAMIYPMVLVFFCLAAIIILTTAVIPKIGEQITATGQQLPWITRQLMNFSYILTSWWLIIVLAGIAAAGWAVKKFLKTEKGAYLKDKFLLSLPLLGPVVKQRVVARFASTLSTLLGSGLAMAESLKIVSQVTGNTLMKNAITQARERILSGADIATPLRDSGVIDPAIAHMVSVGEKSGEMVTMLKNISDNLEASTDIVIERLSAAVEPLIIIVMAGVIGVIAYATILPILEVSSVQF